jgi:hypothetical protein
MKQGAKVSLMDEWLRIEDDEFIWLYAYRPKPRPKYEGFDGEWVLWAAWGREKTDG